MIEVRSLFNRVARATGTALANGFARAALSPPGQVFVRNAGFFTSASNIAANTLLGFRFPWASAAFFAQEPGWALNNLKDRLHDGKMHLHLNPFEPDDRGVEITLPDSIAKAVNAAAPHGKKWAGSMALLGSSLFLAQSWTAGDMHALPLGAAMLLAVSTAASMSQSAAAISSIASTMRRTAAGAIRWSPRRCWT